MDIKTAFQHLVDSGVMQEKARTAGGSNKAYNVYINRFKKDELKTGAMVDLLLEFGYTVEFTAPDE